MRRAKQKPIPRIIRTEEEAAWLLVALAGLIVGDLLPQTCEGCDGNCESCPLD